MRRHYAEEDVLTPDGWKKDVACPCVAGKAPPLGSGYACGSGWNQETARHSLGIRRVEVNGQTNSVSRRYRHFLQELQGRRGNEHDFERGP